MKKLTVFLICLMMSGCLQQYETDRINVGMPLLQGEAESAKVCKTFKPIEEIRCFKKGDLKEALIFGVGVTPDAQALSEKDHFALGEAFGGKCAYYNGEDFALTNTISKDLLRRVYSYKHGFEKMEKDLKVLNQRRYIVRDNSTMLYWKVFGIAASMLVVGYLAGKGI